MTAGSAAQILLAWEHAGGGMPLLPRAKFTAADAGRDPAAGLGRQRGRARGGCGVGLGPDPRDRGRVIAAVSVSGPIERLTRSPGRLHAAAVVGAGEKISGLIG